MVEKGVEVDPEKVESSIKRPTPRSVKNVTRFTGFAPIIINLLRILHV